MNFRKALDAMYNGHKVKRKNWLKDDYIYLKDDVIYCDGEFPYLGYLKSCDFKANDWRIYDERI